MSSNTPSPKESLEATPISASSGSAVTIAGASPTTTPAKGIVLELREDLRPGHVGIDELVSRSEANPSRAAELAKARKWMADTFYREEDGSLRTLRLKKGLSQARLAALCGMTQSNIARLESRGSDVQVSTLERIAKALGEDVVLVFQAFRKSRG